MTSLIFNYNVFFYAWLVYQQPFLCECIKTAIKCTVDPPSDLLIIKLFRLKTDIIAPPGNLVLDVTKSGHHHHPSRNEQKKAEFFGMFSIVVAFMIPRGLISRSRKWNKTRSLSWHICVQGIFLLSQALVLEIYEPEIKHGNWHTPAKRSTEETHVLKDGSKL